MEYEGHPMTDRAVNDVAGSIPAGASTGDGVEAVYGEWGVDPVSRSAGKAPPIQAPGPGGGK